METIFFNLACLMIYVLTVSFENITGRHDKYGRNQIIMRNNPDYFFKKYTCHDILDWVLFLNGVQPGIADFRRVISSTVTSYDQVDVPFAFTKRLV